MTIGIARVAAFVILLWIVRRAVSWVLKTLLPLAAVGMVAIFLLSQHVVHLPQTP